MDNNLTRFVESTSIDYSLVKEVSTQELTESYSNKNRPKILENTNEHGAPFWIPISKYGNLNKNGRIYSRRLFENVKNNQRDIWMYSPMLVNHPIANPVTGEENASPSDICGVYLDMKLDDDPNQGYVYALLQPCTRKGEDLRDAMKAGLKCGTSSSGFGRLLPGTNEVDPDSYLIDRLSDWVLTPSQGTYFSLDSEAQDESHVINSSEGLKESTENNNSSSISESEETTSDKIAEESDNNTDTTNNFKENNKVVKDSKIAKLEEKKFRRDMESFLEEAAAIKDPQERLQEFREIESYLEDGACPDLREKIEQKIAEEEEYIKAAIKEKSELKEKFDVDNIKGLEEKITKIVENNTLLKQDARDWKKVSENLQNKLNEAHKELNDRPTQTFVEYLNTKIDTMKGTLEETSKKAYTLVKKFSEANKSLKQEIESLNEKIRGLEQEKEEMFGELKQAHANAASSNVIAERAEKDKNDSYNNLRTMTESYNTLRAHYEKAILDIKNLNEAANNNAEHVLNEKNNYEAQIKELNEKNSALLKIIAEQRDLIEKKTENENMLNEKVANQKKQLSSMASELKNTQFELYGEKTKEVRRNKVEGSPIVNYYESLYENYGNAVVPFKESILKSRTLSDAQNIFYTKVLPSFRESQEIDSMRLPENTSLKTKMEKMPGFNPNKRSDVTSRLPEGWL